jgi:hypothetical protein
VRNRWSLFLSGFVVFVTWYVAAYVVTSRAFGGVLTGLAWGLTAIIGGLLLGAGVGVAVQALDLHFLHASIRRGDARNGARVNLGKLPDIVSVARRDTASTATELPSPQPSSTVESADVSPTDPAPKDADSDTADAATDGTGDAPPVPTAAAEKASTVDRLAAECARFVAAHEAVAVTADTNGSDAIGSIHRVTHPDAFAAFMALISALAGEGVDVSRVAVSAGPDGLPARVSFPVSTDEKEQRQ